MYKCDWAVVVPMANEEEGFDIFIDEMCRVLDRLESGTVYIIVDKASKDKTYDLCCTLSSHDTRFVTVWAPDNQNVVDAYLSGLREALTRGHEIIIEMDAGMSHDPKALPMFIRVLNEGHECAFGSRFINGGSMSDSPLKRRVLSRGGTFLANLLLGSHLRDMTSGYQGFHAHLVNKLLQHRLISTAHFYQTEIRYLLRRRRYIEVPIHYTAPSPRVSRNAISNAIQALGHYFVKRISGHAITL